MFNALHVIDKEWNIKMIWTNGSLGMMQWHKWKLLCLDSCSVHSGLSSTTVTLWGASWEHAWWSCLSEWISSIWAKANRSNGF